MSVYTRVIVCLLLSAFCLLAQQQRRRAGTAVSSGPDITTSLVGHWPLNDGSGSTAADVSGNGLTGNIVGMGGDASWSVNGGHDGGACLVLGGVSAYMTNADSSLLSPGAGNFTVAIWVLTDVLNSTFRSIWHNYGTASGTPVVFLYLSDANKFEVVVRDDTGGAGHAATATSTGTLSTGTWYHIALVRSGTTARVYVNGVMEDDDTAASLGTVTTSNGSHPATGAFDNPSGSTSSFFDGRIEDLRIYQRALSTADIQALYGL